MGCRIRTCLIVDSARALLALTLTIVSTEATAAGIVPQAGNLSHIWFNDGADKVVKDELRSQTTPDLTNSVWNGTSVRINGARNETVNFNMVLEAASSAATAVSVTFDRLTGPDGFAISSTPTASPFDYRTRDIELFFVRYLQIRGIGGVAYGLYDEHHVPHKLRRPTDGSGQFIGGWRDRPYADKFFPDIAIPLELKPSFTVNAGQNQSIWADIYIPRNAPAGDYTGTVRVSQGTKVVSEVPIRLAVHNFSLPDTNASKTMLFASFEDISMRYTGESNPKPGTPAAKAARLALAEHFKLAKRHRISLFGGEDHTSNSSTPNDRPSNYVLPFLNGSGFTPANGYRGPGEGIGTGFYSIGTYGTWTSWPGGATEAALRAHTDAWETWFQTNLPDVERVFYLIDEPSRKAYAKTERMACWVKNNPGPGSALKTFVTASLEHSARYLRSVDVPAALVGFAQTAKYKAAYSKIKAAGKQVYLYNGLRPGSGSFATEDDGTALRELPWGQYKMGVDRWFYWQSTYYNDFQGDRGQTNVFTTAQTFGAATSFDAVNGQQGHNATNGDGVLFYPGTDKVFPNQSYGVGGPFASLRLKHWRRGIQDIEYLELARAVGPAATAAVVKRMVPRVLWEVDVANPLDPTYALGPVSWSNDPNTWEQARADLVAIIVGDAPR